MAEQNDFQKNQSNKPLNSGQKLTAGVLVLAAIFTLIFGVRQFRNSVKAPFEYTPSSKKTQETETTQSNDIIALQNKDTDEDGLSDYEEMYIYQTSPYIPDSDSDGIDDKKEIDSGGDPNCPKGQDCGAINPNSVDTSNLNNQEETSNETDPFGLSSLGDIAELQSLIGGGSPELETEDLKSILPDELPPEDIKEMLRQAGMPDNIIAQFTDEQLVKTYQETLKKME